MQTQPLLSIILPIYRGAKMLDDTFAQILTLTEKTGARLEIIAVDDGSDDDSFAVISAWQQKYPAQIFGIRLQRNYGEMAALQAGLDRARGDCVARLPQDLQDTIDSVAKMYASWCEGSHINVAYRSARDEPFIKRTMAAIYHAIFRTISNVHDYPSGGLGTFLLDRRVVELLIKYPRRHVDINTRIFALGGARLHPAKRQSPKDKSNWTFAKKIKMVIDNLIGFSYLPVRLMSLVGIVVALASFCFALYVFMGKATGWYVITSPPGWTTIVVLISMLLGIVMIMLGVIGEYLWRILDYICNEPLYIVDESRKERSSQSQDSTSHTTNDSDSPNQ